MAEAFPSGKIVFDAVNKAGLKGINAEVKMAGNKTRSYFYLKDSRKELESWSKQIVNVREGDYFDGYLKGGYKKSVMTKILCFIMKTFHMGFIVIADFKEGVKSE